MRVHLSQAEKKMIEQKCRSMVNFSDGGYWQGIGKAPNCGASERLSNKLSTTVQFDSNEAADRWNKSLSDKARMAQYSGSMAISTSLLILGIAALPAFAIGGAATTLISFFYPSPVTMHRGDRILLDMEYTYSWHTSVKSLCFIHKKITGKVIDHSGKQTYEKIRMVEFNLDEFPEEIARKLASAKSVNRIVSF